MPFQTITLGTALESLADRLSDENFVHWTLAELTIDLVEALQTWNALTNTARDATFFPAQSMVPFYDLGAVVPTLRGLSLTDRQVIIALQFALMEPVTDGSTWNTNSGQFTLDDVTQAIQRRRDQFLMETGAICTRTQLQGPLPPYSQVPIPQQTVTVRRAAWMTSPEQMVSPLFRDDTWGASHFAPGWAQTPSRPPTAFSLGSTPPFVLQLIPPPSDVGTLDLVTVNTGPALSPAVQATLLGIPDDWAWVLKWGVLADLLSRDGLPFDPARAQYAQTRWEQGVRLAQQTGVLLGARINNVPVVIDSLANADAYDPYWQTVAGVPNRVLTVGQNLLALAPPPGVLPGGGEWGITVEVVRNMPVPVLLTDYLQVGPEVLDAIYDYAVHLALFKDGAASLLGSQPLLERFIRQAIQAQNLDQDGVPNRVALLEQTLQAQRAAKPVLPLAAETVLSVGT